MSITQNDFKKIWASTSSVPEYEFSDADYSNGWEFVGNLPPTRAMWDAIQRKNDQKAKFISENTTFVFDDVSKLKLADLTENTNVSTKGYNTINDGGSATYFIRERKVADVDSIDTVLLDNGMTAERIVTITDTNLDSYQNKNDDIVDGIQKNVNGEVIKNKTAELTFPDIHSVPWMQDAVAYNDKLFVATGWDYFCVFDLNTFERIGETYSWDGGVTPHSNPMVWGKKLNDADAYPLLYVSANESSKVGCCYVFSLDADYTTHLIQTISIGFVDKEIWRGEPRGVGLGTDYNGFFFVDTENNYLYAISNLRTAYDEAVGRVFKFALPSTDTDVVLQEADIIETFDIPCYPITQGMHYENGLLYIVSGLHTNIPNKYYLSVVDVDKKGQLVSCDLSDITIEPEGVWSYNGDIYVNLYSLDNTPTVYQITNIPFNQNIGNMAQLQQKKRTLVEVANDTDNRVSILESISFSYPILDYEYVQNVVAQGKGEYVFPVGTKFYTIEKGVKLPWVVMHHGQHGDGRYYMYIRMMLANYIMQYTGVQAFYYAENGLSAGTYYFSVPLTFENVPAGNYQFTLTKNVPVSGLLCLGANPTINCNRDPVGNKVYVFADGKATESLEEAVISSGNSGTLLGSLQRAGDLSNNMNCIHRSVQASNNYAQSLPYQFINSDKFYGSVWESATIFDRYPRFTDAYSGFLNYVPKALLDVIQPAEMPNSTSSVFEVGYSLNSSYTTKKKFWLPSFKQITGTDGGTTGETQFQYYVGKTNAQRIIYNPNGEARPQWLRDEFISYPNLTKSISNAGAGGQNASLNDFAVCPCAEISLPE